MRFEGESQLSVRCFKCGCFGHRGLQCENYMSERRTPNSSAGGMLEKCWICGCLGHIAVECKEKTVTCFSCGQRGHKQEDCKSPMANCWNCGEKGHIKKDCPVKKNVGMCFYCHQVGHHSKDCGQKVCYICGSKDHLCTRCPLKVARGFQSHASGYMRRMRHLQRGQHHQNAFQQQHFSDQLLFDSQYYQSFGQQPHKPPCIRPKSVPLSSEQEGTIYQERPLALRMNSDPMYTATFGSSLQNPEVSQSMRDFGLIHNQSSLSPIDQDRSGFSMADVFNRSDKSSMMVTESEKDSLHRRSLSQSVLDDWKKRISRIPDSGLPLWGSSEVWWNNGLRTDVDNPDAGLPLNTQSEEQAVPIGYNGVELLDNGEKKDLWKTTLSDCGDKQTVLVQDQQALQHTQETPTKSPDALDVLVPVANTSVETISSVIITDNQARNITSTSMKDSSVHVTESSMPSEKQQDRKVQNEEGFVSEANSVESSNSKSLIEVATQENGVHEELKRVREQLAETKEKLNSKEEELEDAQKMVDALKKVIFLDSSVNKKLCPEKTERGAKGADISKRCPKCIQILNNLDSCKECLM